MSTTYAAAEYAADFNLWAQYIDADAVFSREEFDAMSIEARESLAQSVINENPCTEVLE